MNEPGDTDFEIAAAPEETDTDYHEFMWYEALEELMLIEALDPARAGLEITGIWMDEWTPPSAS